MAFPIGPEREKSEWLEADGLGGFASGTVSGIRTRRYHALLLAATSPPSGRVALVNGFDAEIETAAGKFALSTQRYSPGVDTPDGSTRIAGFNLDPWPQWSYAVPGGKIIHELFIPRERAAIVLRWRWEGEAGAPLRLRVRPFFSGRDFHATHHENPSFRFKPESVPEGERWQFYADVPPITARGNGDYFHEPCWYRNFLYDEDLAQGFDATEDLAAPGRYEFDLAAGSAVLIFSADGLGLALPASPSLPVELAEKLARDECARRAAFATPRQRAAQAYVVRRGSGKSIIAGYPWFGDWGRDTFIAMRGLCLATGRLADARDILAAWSGTVSQGMVPNRFPDHGDEPEYNSVDASLWYVIVVHEFLKAAGENQALLAGKEILFAAVEAILSGYHQGTRYGIRGDSDGLLACGVPGTQLTWMDAKVGDWVVTPRVGKPVEVQALWLNALGLTSKRNPRWRALFERGRASFRQRFWNEARACLYDVVDVDHQPGQVDDRLRPNQLFAVGGLPLTLIEGKQAERMVQTVQDRLWTPMGPRSLAPGEKDYAPYYRGTMSERDSVYHQGTVWPWLAGPFVEAWVRVHGGTADAKAKARELFLTPRLARLDLPGLNHVPEIADAEMPHKARGCPFQAWSLGEVLRLERTVL
ncbi:MAG: amylo-alpha-1,6-glucosidase [Methylacidiphilales bacterium]|nr:amylo-alpha-1,6-glucosidase [Candidatus Methylacidiphilales bacterium]